MNMMHAEDSPELTTLLPARRSTGRLLGFCLIASCVLHLGLLAYSRVTPYTPSASPQARGISIELRQNRVANIRQAAAQVAAEAEPVKNNQELRDSVNRIPAPAPLQSVGETHPERSKTAAGSTPQAKPGAASIKQDAGINDLLQKAVRRAMQPHFKYPILARRRGWEGTVKVSVRVESDGELSRLHLVGSSRYGVLDKAAIKSLRQLARIPAAAAWLGGQHFDLVLPVEYRLLDS